MCISVPLFPLVKERENKIHGFTEYRMTCQGRKENKQMLYTEISFCSSFYKVNRLTSLFSVRKGIKLDLTCKIVLFPFVKGTVNILKNIV